MTLWLRENLSVLTLLFSLIVTASTVVYAVLTYHLVMETRRLRKAQSQPHVSVRVENTPGAFGFTDLIVENVGLGPAYRVRFEVEQDLELEPGRRASSIGFIKHGVSYLAPRQRLSSFFFQLIGQGEKVEGPDRPRVVLRVYYHDAAGESLAERFEIDFAHFANMHRLGTPPLDSMAKSLEKIQRDVDHIASGWSKLKVVRYTLDDLDRERQEWEAQRIDQPKPLGDAQPGSVDDSKPSVNGRGDR